MSVKTKCVVWDLDNTIWDGVLTENENVTLKKGITDIIKELDRRGILQSIASKNNEEDAIKKLKEFGISEYFLYPEINWNPKSMSIKNIREKLNLGINTFAFVDDSDFERAEVSHALPEVLTVDAADYEKIPDMDCMNPEFITEDTINRRKMYMSDMQRKKEEAAFEGTSHEFLNTLDMELTIEKVTEADLQRAYELTVRTHQLNSTGYTYSYDELLEYINSDSHIFLIASLKDRFGDYGKIGLALVENTDAMRIKLLLMSCRVMSRGVGSAFLIHLIRLAKKNNKELFADFLETDKNRVMYITYKLMGFEEEENEDGKILLKYDSDDDKEFPEYFHVKTDM